MIGGKWTTFRAFAEQVTDRALADLGRTRTGTSSDRPIRGESTPDTNDEAVLRTILREEAVVHLDDLLLRRTPLGLYERLTPERFAALARLAARELGWDELRLATEDERARRILATRHGVLLQPIPSHV